MEAPEIALTTTSGSVPPPGLRGHEAAESLGEALDSLGLAEVRVEHLRADIQTQFPQKPVMDALKTQRIPEELADPAGPCPGTAAPADEEQDCHHARRSTRSRAERAQDEGQRRGAEARVLRGGLEQQAKQALGVLRVEKVLRLLLRLLLGILPLKAREPNDVVAQVPLAHRMDDDGHPRLLLASAAPMPPTSDGALHSCDCAPSPSAAPATRQPWTFASPVRVTHPRNASSVTGGVAH